MQVTVQRDLYGNGRLVKASDLTLGPRRCTPSSLSTDTEVIFQNGLQECGNVLQMTRDWLIYSTNLTYSPTPPRNSPIIRSNSAVVSIQCYYYRHGNVSSKPIKPTWIPYSSTVSSEERLSFSLYLMTDDWSSRRTNKVFQLGDIFNIEASVDTGNHVPMTIFVDSCVATLTPDINSSPRYEILNQNGCLVDGKQEDSSSAFRSPRLQPDKIQFTVDAFRFSGMDSSTIYITCNLRTAAVTQVPDPMNKACTFTKASNTWSALQGPSEICRCCETGNCAGLGFSRTLGSYYPVPRGIWKREAATGPDPEQEHGLITLGPMLVVGPDRNQAFVITPEPRSLQPWILVAIVYNECGIWGLPDQDHSSISQESMEWIIKVPAVGPQTHRKKA
ncbi:zona pellucida sperm-binding protein 3-like [Rhinophrynus dorsalis]